MDKLGDFVWATSGNPFNYTNWLWTFNKTIKGYILMSGNEGKWFQAYSRGLVLENNGPIFCEVIFDCSG